MILPNQLTVLRILLTPVFLFLFISENPVMKRWALLVYIIAAITDWYDGWLARKFNYITEWGKFMDPLADKILTSAAFLAFVYLGVLKLWMVLVIIVRDVIVTGIRVYADYKKKTFVTSRGAKWKTFFQMAFLYYLLLVSCLKTFNWAIQGREKLFGMLMNENLIYCSMLFVAVFTMVTGISYILNNKYILKRLFNIETE